MKFQQFLSNKLFHDFSLQKRTKLFEWCLLFLLFLISFLVFFYTDYSDTLDNSVMLVKAIWHGQFENYYEYAARNAHPATVYSANYNVFLYGIFALWNFPVILLHRLNGLNYMDSVWALLWCKLLIVLALIFTTVLLRKLVQLCSSDPQNQHMASLLFLGCACTWIPTMVAGQYDILSLLAILLGLYFYIQKNDLWFYVFFAIAFPLKTFAIFVYIPLILLREKRIWGIILKLFPLFSISLAVSLPFRGNSWYELCIQTQSRDALNLLLDASVTIGGMQFNIFAAAYITLCVFCYISDWSEETNSYLPIWCSFAALASILLFTNFRSYWIILIIPFAVLTVFFHSKLTRTNMLLLSIGGTCGGLHILMNHWIYSARALTTKLVLRLMDIVPVAENLKYGSIQKFFDHYDLTRFNAALRTAFIAAFVLLLILNFPQKNAVVQWKRFKTGAEHWPVLLQLFLSLGMVFILLYANLAPATTAVYTTSGTTEILGVNLMDGHTIEQTFVVPEADSSFTVSELSFTAETSSSTRQNRSVLHFTLLDSSTDEILFQKTIGANLIKSNSTTRLDLGSIDLESGHKLCLQVQGEAIKNKTEVTLSKTSSETADRLLKIDGVPITGELFFTLR